jgi:hypothetical protein
LVLGGPILGPSPLWSGVASDVGRFDDRSLLSSVAMVLGRLGR